MADGTTAVREDPLHPEQDRPLPTAATGEPGPAPAGRESDESDPPAGTVPAEAGRPADADGKPADVADPASAGSPAAAGAVSGPGRRRLPHWLANSGTIALLTWLVATPVAFVLPSLTDFDPFKVGASLAPTLGAFLLIVGIFAIATRWSGEVVAGVAAGLAAAWTALMLRAALAGTPFGFGGLVGDMSRMSAASTRYTTTWTSNDTLIPNLPAEYPPFFPWLVGRTAVLLDQPAWTLVGDFQVLFMSASVLAAFLMWRRHVNPWIALAISALSLIAWSDPRKAFEVVTLALFVPWALEVFARPVRERMHWLWAGVIGGALVMTYQLWMGFAALGMSALGIIMLRREEQRAAYVRRILLIIAVSFVVSSWYLVPLLWTILTRGNDSISDLFQTTSLNSGLFPFLEFSPIGLLQLVGLVGLVLLWRSTWWAQPLALLILGTYAFRLIGMIRHVLTEHTLFLHYTTRLYTVMFAIAGVLTLAHVTPIVLRRLRIVPPRLTGAALLAVVMAWVGATYTLGWMPEAGNKYTIAAHSEPLPGGGYPRWAPKDEELRRAAFPVREVERAVEQVTGPDPSRPTLSVDDRLWSYLPWPGYLENDRTASSSLVHWDDRFAELRRVADTTDPAAFAAASRETAYGPIDIFVLRQNEGRLMWVRGLSFTPEQFSPEHFTVVEGLSGGIVVAIRK
ncbi:arabinofuranosyltransferase [Polymorphospora rubra]|uniref:arabinofuranosyltransferase n=1 Tax=Polymorphospora rubra TaxID=338584 RepID=UPI0033E5910A